MNDQRVIQEDGEIGIRDSIFTGCTNQSKQEEFIGSRFFLVVVEVKCLLFVSVSQIPMDQRI